MNPFELVKAVLDRTVEKIAERQEVERKVVLSQMKKHLLAMSNAYFSGKQPLIAYGDPLLRAGYLFSHAAVNSHLFSEALYAAYEGSTSLIERTNAGQLSVCAFGGGPGTELIGLASLFSGFEYEKDEEQIEIEFRLIDRVNEWSESFSALKKKINESLTAKYGKKKNWPFSIETSFLTFNITQTKSYNNYIDIFESDIFVMNYMISEVIDGAADLEAVIKKVASKSKKGAVFLVIDRNQEEVLQRSEQILKGAGLKVSKPHITESKLTDAKWSEKHHLNEYIEFMDRRPRRTWSAFWQIGTKS